ncbi:pore-forming ESAT-6 family protein [Streptomyces bohaiensis]|uniref:Pore-forming ESAT-6 family protein n=1 Tax=Streptomyces bohaiensis TaxID=1431344 RepID=A0ABX1CES3_9ACTN|nr:pore-forming ESAT-6 family protein [Streptomyces bohaiensis]NJQ17573.1 pore-forming ESAT-6 family protein [Streptomyces bohaiensis]
MSDNRLAYDTAASGEAAENLKFIIGRLETLMSDHRGDVSKALSDFEATGVSEEYAGVEEQWDKAAGNVQNLITALREVLGENDIAAQAATDRARQAVEAIRS